MIFADIAVFADFAGFPAQRWSDSSEAVRVGRKPQPALTRQAGTAIIAAVLEKPYLTPQELGWATSPAAEPSALRGSVPTPTIMSDVRRGIRNLNPERFSDKLLLTSAKAPS